MTGAPDVGAGGPSTEGAGVRAVAALRVDLEASGYTVDGVAELLGPVASAALHREQAVPALRATAAEAAAAAAAGRTPPAAATLLRLLVLGVPVRRDELDAALPRTGAEGAERLGLVRAAGQDGADPVRALVDLRPHGDDWWLASDLGELATGSALRTDHVLGVGGASTTLAQITLRTPRRRTLDVGTGCGVQALGAARHSDAVVATDISARALRFARFNAALAGVELDLRRGSMLEPVAGDPAGFDLVVSNPPFVISPPVPDAERYEYRDGGRGGDDVVRDLVLSVGTVLAPGGVAQMLGNWEIPGGQDWTERVGAWVDVTGLDAWVVQREVQDPAEYVELWLRDGGTTPERDPQGWRDRYARWLDDFAARDVLGIGFGFVLLRRPRGPHPTLRRLEEISGPLHRPVGDHLAAALAAHDRLAGRDDAALAGERLVRADDVTEERHLVPGAVDPTLVLLRQGDGYGRTVRAGTALAGLVGACDGEITVGGLVGALAALLDVGTDDLWAELAPQVRGLVVDGFLRLGEAGHGT